MKKYNVKKYLVEAARSKGEEMEQVIVNTWNGEDYLADPSYKIPPDAGTKIVQSLKDLGVTGRANVTGQDNISVTKNWAQWWQPLNVPASTKTPKTDFTIGKYKISLKAGNAAQLMSGGKNESIATFYSATSKMSNAVEPIIKSLGAELGNMTNSSIAASRLADEIKSGQDEVVVSANLAHQKIKTQLKSALSNDEFRYWFAYEAMSGADKFGGNVGTATHFLSVSFDGNDTKLHSLSDSSYVNSIANKMKPTVRFKTTSVKRAGKKTGEYRYWSVVSLIVDKLTEEVDSHGGILTEAIFTSILLKIKKFITTLLRKIVKFIGTSVKRLMEFLELEPHISFNNEVKL